MTRGAPLEPGLVVGKFIIHEKLGEGGFGAVYRAVNDIDKVGAVKVLHRQYSADPEMVSRFKAEARSVNQIRHRNIIDIFEFGELPDGRQYYVMEYLDGAPMDQYLASRGRLPLEEAIPILTRVARALDAAHAKGIAHRDLKPENIFLAQDADGDIEVKLLDFGIAKLLRDEGGMGSHKTRTGAPIGTPYYMSPEQCRGRNVDHRTDIYAFGCVVHQTLTGSYTFDGEDYMEIILKQLQEEPPRMSSLVPEMPEEVDAPVLWMLEKDPEKRPPTLMAAVNELARAAQAVGIDVPVRTTASGVGAVRGAPSHRLGTPAPGGTGTLEGIGSAATMASTGVDLDSPGPRKKIPSGLEATEMGAPLPASVTGLGEAGAGTGAGVVAAAAPSVEFESASGKRGLVMGGVLLAAGLVAAAVYLARGPSAESEAEPAATAAPAETAEAPPEPAIAAETDRDPGEAARAVEPPPSPVDSANQTGESVEPATVKLELSGVPAGAEVVLDGEVVATGAGTVKLPRGDEPLVLEVRKKGYRASTVEFVPSADGALVVELERVKQQRRRPQPAKPKRGSNNGGKNSIENPF